MEHSDFKNISVSGITRDLIIRLKVHHRETYNECLYRELYGLVTGFGTAISSIASGV